MKSFRMCWAFIVIVLSFTFNNLSEAENDQKKHPSAVVVGTVYCDTCFQADFSKTSHFISGALVAVKCRGTGSRPSFREEVKTNNHGKFTVHLPFSVTKHVKRIKECSVKLISSSEPYCSVASTATSSSLHLKSRKQGTHIFSAGFFTFKPLKQPTLCNQKPSVPNSEKSTIGSEKISTRDDPSFPPPIQEPPTPFLPPIDGGGLPEMPGLPTLPPLPELPPLPPLPGLPNFPPAAAKSESQDPLTSNKDVAQKQIFGPLPQLPPLFASAPPILGIRLPPIPFQLPNPFTPPSPSVVPTNPIQPPPLTVVPPNPFQAPPSVLPPNPFQPSPPLAGGAIIPRLTPPPSPPTPTAFSFPLPPFPFQPSPGFPGIPPASSSSLKKTSP